MPNRFERSQTVLAKLETTYGTDPTPTPSADAVLVSNLSVTPLEANNVDRDLIRPYFGSSEQLVGTRTTKLSFDVELVGSGVAGTPPAWDVLLRACAFARSATAAYVSYLPLTENQASITLYLNDAGVLHVMPGARGTVVFKLNAGEKPVMSFSFTGLYGPVSAQAVPSPVYSAFRTPQVPNDAQTMDLTFGGALDLTGVPAITGGSALPSLGIEIDTGNDVPFTPLIGGETVDVTDRKVLAKIRVDQTAAQEVSRLSTVLLATLSSVGILHGTVVGDRVLLWMPSAQFIEPGKDALNGRRLQNYSLRGVPVAGNDELRVITCF